MLQFTDQLMNIAWRAFIYKKVEPLERPARLLMRLPYPHNAIGKYYMGVFLTRTGCHVESLQFLEQAALEAPQMFQARAISCMSTMAWEAGDLDSARILAEEALCAATWRSGSDMFIRLAGRHTLAILPALQGESARALKMFFDLLPEMAASAEEWPSNYFSLLNSIAMELMAVNRLDDARRTLAVVLAAPYRHHQWLDTAHQLRSKMEWSGLREPDLLRFPDEHRLSNRDLLDCVNVAGDGKQHRRSPVSWPESLIKGCTLRGKLSNFALTGLRA